MKNDAPPLQSTIPQALTSSSLRNYQEIARASREAMLIATATRQSSTLSPEKFVITFVNEAFTALTDYRFEQIIGEPLIFLNRCTSPVSSLEALWQAISCGETINRPWRCLSQSGLEFETELALIPLFDAAGTHCLIIIKNTAPPTKSKAHSVAPLPIFDISALGTIQEFIESLALDITVLDSEAKIIAANRNARDRFSEQHGLETVIGTQVTASSLSLFGENFEIDFARTLQGQSLDRELNVQHPNADSQWYYLSYSPLQDEISTQNFVVIVTSNVTDGKATEEALARTMQHFALATENAKAGIWDLDIKNEQLYIDSNSKAMFGYPGTNFESDLELWKKCIHPDDYEAVIQAIYEHFDGETEQYHQEFRVLHQDGTYHWMLSSAKAIRDSKGIPVRLVGTSIDVTERKVAEETVRTVQENLEQQIHRRTSLLFQTVESLQHQIRERKRVEMKVRRRLNDEQALRDISIRLMRETNFDQAATATLADIGEKLDADKIILLRFQLIGESFFGSHSWSSSRDEALAAQLKLMAAEIPRLLKHLRGAGYLMLSKSTDSDITSTVEITAFQEWYHQSMLLLPLNVSDELVGLLLCCDAERLQDEREEGLHFVQAAVGMLSAMLRIDQMMNALEKRVAEQTEELAAFFNMAVLASGSEHVTETLAAALTMVRELGNCDAVCVHVLSPDGAALQLAYQVGLDHVDHRHLLRIPNTSALFQRVQRTSTPILITELNPTVFDAHLDEFHTYFGAPMVVRNNVQGLLSCYWRFVHGISLSQMSLLTALTDQLGIILENQRLHRHAQEVGVIHERQRLARELHDSVTQSMYGVMIFARAGREALEDNAFRRLSDCLAQVEEASLRSLKEMRLLLYQLRPLALESQGLVEAIRSRLELVEHRLGIDVDMQMNPIVGLSHAAEEALYHVAMEALNNVLKHADADRVTIQLHWSGNYAELLVSDDGVGFELEKVNHSMGINNMRDRINALGGNLTIHTQVDQGTTIIVRIPKG